jgi:DNA-directed RNA polymerase specialized sigma24 family protein
MTDKTIIEHLRHNKYSMALKGLYDMFPAVNQYIKTNSGFADDARDVFQDTLVVLYKKVHSGDLTLTVPLKVYLLAIAKNCWLQKLPQPFTDNLFKWLYQ